MEEDSKYWGETDPDILLANKEIDEAKKKFYETKIKKLEAELEAL